jgi:hypothetical protein
MGVTERATVATVAQRKAQRLDDSRLSTSLVAAGLALGAVVLWVFGSALDIPLLAVVAAGMAVFSAALTGAAVVLSALRDTAREESR